MRDFIKTFIGLLLIAVIIYAVFYILNIEALREKETKQEEIIVEKESPYVNRTVVEEPKKEEVKNEVKEETKKEEPTNKVEEKSDLDKLQSIINSKKSAIESTTKTENKVENKVENKAENKPVSSNTTNTTSAQNQKMIPGSSIITPDIKTTDIKK